MRIKDDAVNVIYLCNEGQQNVSGLKRYFKIHKQ